MERRNLMMAYKHTIVGALISYILVWCHALQAAEIIDSISYLLSGKGQRVWEYDSSRNPVTLGFKSDNCGDNPPKRITFRTNKHVDIECPDGTQYVDKTWSHETDEK